MRLKLTRFAPLKFLLKNLRAESTYHQPFFHLLKFLLKGFSSDQIAFYQLSEKNYREYPRDIFRYRTTHNTNRNVWPILHDKLCFEGFMRGKLPIVPSLFYVCKGTINAGSEQYSVERFEQEIRAGQRFVIKPIQGGMGENLLFLKPTPNGFKLNETEYSFGDLTAVLSGLEYHLCCAYVQQHDDIERFYPGVTNTVRVTSYMTTSGEARLTSPFMRFGTRRSAPVDTFGKGGVAAAIDLESGMLTNAFIRGQRAEKLDASVHPETGRQIVGFVIPFWKRITETILKFQAIHPCFDLVGWDVIITHEGFLIIEGNHNPETSLLVMFNKDPDFIAFLKDRNIIA